MLGIFGNIENPTKYTGAEGQGLFALISNILKLAGLVAGLFFIVQIIMAGYAYLTAENDPKKLQDAFAKIWQSIIGLLIVASAFVLAALIGRILGINPLTPEIYGPTS